MNMLLLQIEILVDFIENFINYDNIISVKKFFRISSHCFYTGNSPLYISFIAHLHLIRIYIFSTIH